MRIRKESDGSYTIIPILKNEAVLLEMLFTAYEEWKEKAFPTFTAVYCMDNLDTHLSDQFQPENVTLDLQDKYKSN